jgi:site-specific DNA recombinase
MKTAIYARYSTSLQRAESIEDQFRVCERIADRNGFTVVARYSDAAISGGTALKRPQYQQLLADARAGRFQVIIAEDTSRLWRNLAEQSPRLAEFADLGIAVVTHDLDTRQESSAILGAVTGAMSEGYRREIARRTRRGLEGLARAKRPTGGRAYGYVAAADADSGDREVDEAQAKIVRRIFQDYADGLSAVAICAALNRERVPSPGSSWGRNVRRSNGWVVSAIAGDRKRGIGILNNELYCGRVIWNRFRWVRSAADSSKRKCLPNPRKDWIEHQDERLRIVPQSLWDRVKQRQADLEQSIGLRIAAGIAKGKAGPRPRHLLSGLLRCGSCGANFVVSGRDTYACSAHVHGRDCDNTVRLKRAVVEPLLITGVRETLTQPEVLAQARRAVDAALKRIKNDQRSSSGQIDKLRAEIANLTDAIAAGALRGSRAIAERLAAAEAELDRIETEASEPIATAAVLTHTHQTEAKLKSAANDLLATVKKKDPERGRAAIHALVGNITVCSTPTEVRFESESGAVEKALLSVAGAKHTILVAGVGFEPTTFGL